MRVVKVEGMVLVFDNSGNLVASSAAKDVARLLAPLEEQKQVEISRDEHESSAEEHRA